MSTGGSVKRTFANLLGRVQRTGPLAAGMVLVLAAGLVHGLWTDRWSNNADLEAAAGRLRAVPLDLESWTGRAQEFDTERIARAEAAGHLSRIYEGPDGQKVSVVMLCGRFGPLAVHTPDICYGGAGYEMLGVPARFNVPLSETSRAEVWTARFHRPGSPGDPPLRVVWAWSAGKGWLAPKLPRWTFRREPVLYKLYVAREMSRADEPAESDPCFAFLRVWLPRVDTVLFGFTAEKGDAQ
jgi:hypothetical protein